MLNKAIETIMQKDIYKYNKQYADEMTKEATEMFNAGWDAIAEDQVITYKGNQVILRRGNSIINVSMKNRDFSVCSGKIYGEIEKINATIDLSDEQKATYLAKAIVTRFYTIPKM